MSTFDGVDFGPEVDVEGLVLTQLRLGLYRRRIDDSPSSWLEAAWRHLPAPERQRVGAAVHSLLTHPEPEVRLGALSVLDRCGRMWDEKRIVDVATEHLELFRGIRKDHDPPHKDRGKDLVRMASAVRLDDRTDEFCRQMALTADYGQQVLAALAQHQPQWLMENVVEIVAKGGDRLASRIDSIVFAWRYRSDRLSEMARRLLAAAPDHRRHLETAIEAHVAHREERAELLALVAGS